MQTDGYKLAFTTHAANKLTGFIQEDARENAAKLVMNEVSSAFTNPEKVYPNRKYKGQHRVVGNGYCMTGEFVGKTKEFLCFTIIRDGVMTPPRPDQLETPEGREYARLYQQHLKTGRVKRKNEYYPRIKQRNSGVGHIN